MSWVASIGLPLTAIFVLTGCAPATAQVVSLNGASETMTVKGQYQPLKIDEVDGVSLKNGQLVVRGSFESVAIDLPPIIDVGAVTRHWALVTESNLDNRKVISFTHDELLDDFTLEIPPTEAEMRYGVFAGKSGGEVMVLTWGTDAKCYWGWVTINRTKPSPPGR